MRARGAMPLIGAEHGRRAGGRDAIIAARSGGRVRAVAAVVARRVVLPGQLRVDAGVAAPASVVVLRADQLLVAVGGGELLAGDAPAVPAGDLLVAQLAVLGAIAVQAGAVREARVLGPDAAVDDADDDVFTGASDTAELLPQAAGSTQSQECGRGGRINIGHLVRGHRDDTRMGGHLVRLLEGHCGCKTVEGVIVAVHLAAARPVPALRRAWS